jgi:hypothetical protein
MKTLSFVIVLLFSFALSTSAQTKTQTLAVSGVCGMCKKKIETAARNAGASYAVWNVDSKELTVKYNSESSNAAKIQQAIADAGYDTPAAKASDSAYKNLHGCCKYERTAKTEACCTDASCCAGGKCNKEAACCKEADCCKEGTCAKHNAEQTAAVNGSKPACCAKH